MSQLCIIPCGRKKIWDKEPTRGATDVRNTYIGTFHRLCRNYANQFTNQWVVLSAKHGFLLPNDIVDRNYDVTFSKKNDEIISLAQLQYQIESKKLDQYDELILLTGKKYEKIIEASFGQQIPKHFPLKSYKGMGYMQQALKHAVEQNISLH